MEYVLCIYSYIIREHIFKGNDDPLFSLEIDKDDTVKSLGLYWKPVADEFTGSVIQIR